MNLQKIEEFSQIPQPEGGVRSFTEELKKVTPRHFKKETSGEEYLKDGVRLYFEEAQWEAFPETAVESLRRVFTGKEITECDGGYPVYFKKDAGFEKEEYMVSVQPEKTEITAADADGLRRGIYVFEDKLSEAAGRHAAMGEWRAKPFIKHRISRCFFGPTYRPPLCIDELTDDVDYYPEGYLDRLAHEGVNGLWLTMYFKDLPSSLFPENGKDSEKRFEKLRDTVRRCARYGIKIYVFLSEPKYLGDVWKSYHPRELEKYPELVSWEEGGCWMFCTSNDTARTYIRESIACIFGNVPGLGGAINIMIGEDNASCIGIHTSSGHREGKTCPVCASKDEAESYRELAELYADTMHEYNPDAEFIGWFYTPMQRDGSEYYDRLIKVAEKWPDKCSIMFNFESGGGLEQEGKQRIVFDYSLAYVGPSGLFEKVADTAARTGAKLQVGCSHEDASVPFIPVPENLYDKYKFMYEHGVSAVMQCWYFGNYPGLMNQAAGRLSFEPFCEDPEEFLTELAKPQWREHAPAVAKAWHEFSQAYRKFPGNIAFEWFGPLHNSIAWPMHLFPADKPIAPSWILGYFPQVSGDRIGETLCFHHNLTEARNLCFEMNATWAKGLDSLRSVQDDFADDEERMADIRLAEAIGLQMDSTANLLQFYLLREDMLYKKEDHLDEMKAIVCREMENTRRMCALCEMDPRLGYHSEAEGYLFYPEKLREREKLLEQLLEDFAAFDLQAEWIDRYTGKVPEGKAARCTKPGEAPDIQYMENGVAWSAFVEDGILKVKVAGAAGRDITVNLEPCRMWAAFHIEISAEGHVNLYEKMFREYPDVKVEFGKDETTIGIPLELFDGFRREGFPVHFNVFGDGYAWVAPRLWPSRLLHGTYSPEGAGWLFLE